MIMTAQFETDLSKTFEAIAKTVLEKAYKNTDFKQSAIYTPGVDVDKNRYFAFKIKQTNKENDFVIDNLLVEALITALEAERKGNTGKILQDASRIFLFTTNDSLNVTEEIIFSGIVKYTFNAAKKIIDANQSIKKEEKPYCYRSLAMSLGNAFYEMLKTYALENKSRWAYVLIRNDFLEYLALGLLKDVKEPIKDKTYVKKAYFDEPKEVAECFADIADSLLKTAIKETLHADNQKFYENICMGGFNLYEIDFLIDICEHIHDILDGCQNMLENPITVRLKEDEKAAIQRILYREFNIADNDPKKEMKENEVRARTTKAIDAYLKHHKLMELCKGSIPLYPKKNDPEKGANAWTDPESHYVATKDMASFSLGKEHKSFFIRRNRVNLTERNFISNYTNKDRGVGNQLSDELFTFQHHVRARTIIHETLHMVPLYQDYTYLNKITMHYESEDDGQDDSGKTVFYFSQNAYEEEGSVYGHRDLIASARKPLVDTKNDSNVDNKFLAANKTINVDSFVKVIGTLYFMYAKRTPNQRFIGNIYASRKKITDYLVANLHYALKKSKEKNEDPKNSFFPQHEEVAKYHYDNLPTFVEKLEADLWWKKWESNFDNTYKRKSSADIENDLNEATEEDQTYDNLFDMFTNYTGVIKKLYGTFFAEYVRRVINSWHQNGEFKVVSYHAADLNELYNLSKPDIQQQNSGNGGLD
jgi:hypothetical protein